MKRTLSLFLATVSLVVGQAFQPVFWTFLRAAPAAASTRPHYGGTLRVELSARVASLDPAERPADGPEAAAKQRLLNLAFDPLVRLDENGQPHPALAVSWKSDATFQRWEFRLRPNMKFHDGTLLALSDVVTVLTKVDETWRVSATGDSVVIQCNEARPNLLFELSMDFIFRRTADRAILGTGPFRIANWQPGARAVFSANEDFELL